jgi:hypothetical protein
MGGCNAPPDEEYPAFPQNDCSHPDPRTVRVFTIHHSTLLPFFPLSIPYRKDVRGRKKIRARTKTPPD